MGCAAAKEAYADSNNTDDEQGRPPVGQEQFDDKAGEAWLEYDGASIESELRVDQELGGSPVRLVDARYLIELEQQGGIFIRRQDMPESAFLSLDTVKQLPAGGQYNDCLRIISISHPWQHPNHPDPKSINLKLLARVLKAFVEHKGGGTYAVFLDVRMPHVHKEPPKAHPHTLLFVRFDSRTYCGRSSCP